MILGSGAFDRADSPPVVSRATSSVLFGLIPVAPGTTLVVGLALFVVAVVASYIPARRAASLDPMLALRYE